jgi:hypothetical protein
MGFSVALKILVKTNLLSSERFDMKRFNVNYGEFQLYVKIVATPAKIFPLNLYSGKRRPPAQPGLAEDPPERGLRRRMSG